IPGLLPAGAREGRHSRDSRHDGRSAARRDDHGGTGWDSAHAHDGARNRYDREESFGKAGRNISQILIEGTRMKAQVLAALLLAGFSAPTILAQKAAVSWKEYLGGPDSSHYSPLKQINTSNVHKLEVA